MGLGGGRIVHRGGMAVLFLLYVFFIFFLLPLRTCIINKLLFPSSFGCFAKDAIEYLSEWPFKKNINS